ncbi:DNA (cytosine-5-)-methyltransferase [Alishewanella sp. d11]|uniref:DNA (cytosine-5-)-methyltransferase n=1 Tax=Alishewanella sp. d11 TaxID=3414030 RepID=UPI003BF8A335
MYGANTKKDFFTIAEVADILGVSKETLRRWETSGKLVPDRDGDNNYRLYTRDQIESFEQVQQLFDSNWDSEFLTKPLSDYSIVELFAGAGGLALGMEKAGFKSVLLNELDQHACKTLKENRPSWNVVQGDISKISFTHLKGQVDVLSGGFPCQAFSYAGKKLGFEDTRGTLFFEFARAVKEIQPKVILAENVRGLLKHDNGKTLETIKSIIDELGYEILGCKLLKAVFYQVPQKRERLFIVAVRKELISDVDFSWPSPYKRIMNLSDALKAGELYPEDVPLSNGQKYPARKAEIMAMVPPGGYWRDLPYDVQVEYMKGSLHLGGGKTGMARRLSWNEPSLTLTCAPAQKQTERCHPDDTRPLTVREYARIQTFPDQWVFSGPITAQYKQIGNAVPVNLAYAVGRSIIRMLNAIELPTRKKLSDLDEISNVA